MFEHRHQQLISKRKFLQRVWKFSFLALLLILGSWAIGILGYALLENMAFVDAMLNSSMILGGMGPVSELHTVAGKIFASFYALFSGVVFLISVGVLLAPIIHRLLHRFHLQSEKN